MPSSPQEDWPDRLGGDSPAEARAELVALGKEAVPILLAVLGEAQPEAAFQASVALGELGTKGKAAVPDLLLALDNASLGAERRSYYALALSGSESSSKKVVPALLDHLGRATDVKVTRAVQVSLAALGKRGAASTLKAFSTEGDPLRLFQLGEALVAQGSDGAKGVRSLGKWVADVETGYRGLQSINVLRAIGKKGAKTLEQALRKRPVAPGALLPLGSATDWERVIMFLRGQVDVTQVPTTNLSLPPSFKDLVDDSYITLPEILVSLSGHLGQETGRLSVAWRSGAIQDAKSWRAEVRGIERSEGLIRSLLSAR